MTTALTERVIYGSRIRYLLNLALFPFKQIIPQPIIAKIPLLTTNEDIRVGLVRANTRGKLLDIGCGKNRLAREYRAHGGEGVGVDVYDWGACDLIVPDTSKLPFADASFETITFVACLNHIPNRTEVLREAKRLLMPGGHLLITNITPVISRIWHTYAFWDKDQHERGMEEGEVYGFAPNELLAILDSTGFKVDSRCRFSWRLNELFICSAKT